MLLFYKSKNASVLVSKISQQPYVGLGNYIWCATPIWVFPYNILNNSMNRS